MFLSVNKGCMPIINGIEYEMNVEYDKWFHTQSGLATTGDKYLLGAEAQGIELKIVDPNVKM